MDKKSRVVAKRSILTKPANIAALVATMRARKHSSTETAFDYLSELIGPHIRIRYDAEWPDTGSAAQSAVGWSKLRGAKVHRIMLTANKTHSDLSYELARQCNGLVLEWPSLDILSMPAPLVNHAPKMSLVRQRVEDGSAKVYPINDGTTVTLYWTKWCTSAPSTSTRAWADIAADDEVRRHDGWAISSANGIEVNTMSLNTRTYFDELVRVSGVVLDSLDRARCYTIGFRSHDFHPMKADPERAWMIQSTVTATGAVDPVPADYKCPHTGLHYQAPLDAPQWDDMMRANSAALEQYRSGSATETTPHYGYLIRGDFAEGGSVVVIESTLLTRVRRSMYDHRGCNVFAAERRQYIVFRSFLSFDPHIFIELFPQYRDQFDAWLKDLTALSGHIYDRMRGRTSNAGVRELLVSAFVTELSRELTTVSPYDAGYRALILTYLRDPRYCDVLFGPIVNGDAVTVAPSLPKITSPQVVKLSGDIRRRQNKKSPSRSTRPPREEKSRLPMLSDFIAASVRENKQLRRKK